MIPKKKRKDPSRDIWASGFEPYLDGPVKPRPELAAVVGGAPTTRRSIAKALLQKFVPYRSDAHSIPLNPALCKLFELKPSNRPLPISTLLRRIDRQVIELRLPMMPVPDEDLVLKVRQLEGSQNHRTLSAIDIVLARYDEIIDNIDRKECDRPTAMRLYVLVGLAVRLLNQSSAPEARMREIMSRAAELATLAKDTQVLLSGIGYSLYKLSKEWISRMEDREQALDYWHQREIMNVRVVWSIQNAIDCPVSINKRNANGIPSA